MSELEKKTEETPKRKRRTKEEIEAAKANGTYKPRAKKSIPSVETTETEGQMKEKKEKYQTRPPEQNVLIMACLQPSVAKAATDAAHDMGVEVVILEDKVIKDYLEAKVKNANPSLQGFLSDTSNRLKAEAECRKLYAILTKGGKVEDADDEVWTTTEVVRETTLSHSQARSLFEVFRAFGLVEMCNKHEFRFCFKPELRRSTILREIESMIQILNADIQRYKTAVYSDDALLKEKKDELYKKLGEFVDENIEF